MTARHRMRLVALGLLIILSLVFFHQLAFGGKILARGDTFEYFYPYWDARNQAFREGRLPLWTPDLFMGVPLLANPQLGIYYPPNWLTAPFRAPRAITLSILFHIVLAGAGACWLYRETVSQRWRPALAAAVVYAFSGFLGAHVEQINQLQGLAWLPLLFALSHRLLTRDRPLRDGLLLGMAWALQIFSGHSQTVFISGLGLAAFAIALSARAEPDTRWKRRGRALLMLACSGAVALCLSLPQLLPSLELLRLSIRSDGLAPHSVSAFSLPPDLLGRALLPSYDGQLFGEYVGAIGVIGLGLALWGVASRPRSCGRKWIWLSVAALGLLLAFGNHNPLYRLLDDLPPLNYFRAPARFLSLFTLGMAILAGMGVEALETAAKPAPAEPRRIALALCPLLLMIALTIIVSPANPEMIFGDSSISARAIGLWLGAALLLAGLLLARGRWIPIAALALLTGELFLAAQNLPYNDLSPPDVYLGQRAAITELLALQADEPAPGRTLGISQIFFDPVDITELRRRYDALGMGYWAQFHALDAVKKQETLMPNLALTWGIPGLDGYGGGITPTRHYVLYSSLLLPDGAASAIDGRLGERLALPACRGACMPELRWLRASDTQYIITDYVYDIQHDDIAYDTALAPYWAGVSAINPPETSADQIRILYRAPVIEDDSAIELPHGLWLRIADYAEPAALIDALRDKENILAVTLVDSREPQNTIQLQPPPFERLHVSAVKIYRQATGERAFLAGAAHILPDSESGDAEALRLLRAGEPLTLHGDAEALAAEDPGGGTVEILSYSDTRIELRVMAAAPAWLVLKDAYYPGWEASVNGAPTPIYRANLLFRALRLPAGESVVSFRFEPALWRAALYIGLALWIIAAIVLFRLRSKENAA